MLRTLFAICMAAAAAFAWADDKAALAARADVKGEVLEVRNVANYTYLRLKTGHGETWAAVVNAPVRQGQIITIRNASVMHNFESKALKRTFPTILLGTLDGAGAGAPGGQATGAADSGKDGGAENVHVEKAGGANAYTVSEIIARRAELKGRVVVLRAKVGKYNPNIMGRNWLHLRDGSGSSANNTNDLLVTSASAAKVGDVVTATGVVRTDKDFGAGYSYKVLIEDATLQ